MRWSANPKNKKISIFRANNQGVMSIEMAIVMLTFFGVIFFAINIGTYYANKSKIERVTYSLSSIFRERTSFYNGKENIDIDDVNELAKVGTVMLGEELADGSILMVEGLYFDNNNLDISVDNPILRTPPTQTQIVSLLDQGTDINTISFECFNHLKDNYPLIDFKDMSIWSIKNRWATIYRVSLCVPNRSRFSLNFFNYVSKLPKKYIITSTVLAR